MLVMALVPFFAAFAAILIPVSFAEAFMDADKADVSEAGMA